MKSEKAFWSVILIGLLSGLLFVGWNYPVGPLGPVGDFLDVQSDVLNPIQQPPVVRTIDKNEVDSGAIRRLEDPKGGPATISYMLDEGVEVRLELTNAVALGAAGSSSIEVSRQIAGHGLTRVETEGDDPRFVFYVFKEIRQPAAYRRALAEILATGAIKEAFPVLFDAQSGRRVVWLNELTVQAYNYKERDRISILADSLGGAIGRDLYSPARYLVRFKAKTGFEALETLDSFQAADFIEWAEPNLIQDYRLNSIPNDTLFDYQWHLDNAAQLGLGSLWPGLSDADIDADYAWDYHTGDSSVVIAIIDSGVECTHPDLDCVPGYDFYDNDSNALPATASDNHGQACAGVAAAQGDNGIGVSGACQECRIMPIKVSKSGGFTSDAVLADALEWAVDNGADVLSNSWGGGSPSTALHNAIIYAGTNGRDGLGAPVLFATGNSRINDNSDFGSFRISGLWPGVWTAKLTYTKDGSESYYNDTVYVDNVLVVNGNGAKALEQGFVTDSLPGGWTQCSGSSAPWTGSGDPNVYYAGINVGSLRSGSITHGQNSCVQFSATVTVTAGYFYLAYFQSSEPGYDVFSFTLGEGGSTYGPWSMGYWQSAAPTTTIIYPSRWAEAISVGASTDWDVRSTYSQYGPELDFVAPSNGGWASITTTDRTGSVGYNDGSSADDYADAAYTNGFGGTSSATPLAAGVAGLLIANNPNILGSSVRQVMRENTDQIGPLSYPGGRNDQYGYGRINAGEALAHSECAVDEDCDDGYWCNGDETCVTGACQPGTAPCPDDGLFCNGTESCNEGSDSCDSSGDPCGDDGLFCNGTESCNEGSDSCDSSGDPCGDDGLFCNGTESCNEGSDSCDSSGDPCGDDGLFCNGTELCNEGSDSCDSSGDPCGDDGLFCNGTEFCNEGADSCDSSGDPCGDDGLFCNGTESCNEGSDTCDSSGDPCPGDSLFCNGSEYCNEGSDSCDSSGDPCGDDGLFCNGTEFCNEGADSCDSSGDPCGDDGLFCNGTESCDEIGDACLSSGYPCDPEIQSCKEATDSCASIVNPEPPFAREWVSRISLPENSQNNPLAMAISDTGEVYLASYFGAAKLDSSGTLAWSRAQYGAMELVAQSSTGNFVFAGEQGAVELTPDGTEVWFNDSNTYITDLAVDDDGNVLIYSEQWGNFFKYDSNGYLVWSRYDTWMNGAVAFDGLGNAIITGASGSPSDIYLSKYDPAGNEIWSLTYDGPDQYDDYPTDVAIDLNGNVIVSGYTFRNVGGWDVLTVKFDAETGSAMWTGLISGPNDGYYDRPNEISTDWAGNVLLAGELSDANDLNAFAAKYDGSGNELWRDLYYGAGGDVDRVWSLAVTPRGDLLVAGETFSGWEIGYQFLTMMYDGIGNRPWMDLYNGPYNIVDTAMDVGFDTSGNVYVVGYSTSDDEHPYTFDYVVIKYEPCSGCVIDNLCYLDGETNPANICEICDVSLAIDQWSPNNVFCEDGFYCNGAEICVVGVCQPGTAPNCNDGVSCTNDSCNETTDACVNTPNNAVCDNGQWCDGAETCDAFADCQAGTPPDCSDGVGCTNDSCNETTDTCDNITNDANCDNDQWCDGAETCDAFADCQAGTPPDCSDGVGCTNDSCNETTDACVNTPNNALCDNGQWCDGAETCDAVSDCQPGTAPDCNDNVACTDDTCDEAGDACVNQAKDANCDDNAWCNGAETCDSVLDCQPGVDPCDPVTQTCNETDDICESAGPVYLTVTARMHGSWNGAAHTCEQAVQIDLYDESMFLIDSFFDITFTVGGTAQADLTGVAPGSYFVVLRHLNHVDLMTGEPVVWDGATPVTVDLTNPANVECGTSTMYEYSVGVWTMPAGDIVPDHRVALSDFNYLRSHWTETDPACDLDCDGFCRLGDFNKLRQTWNTQGCAP